MKSKILPIALAMIIPGNALAETSGEIRFVSCPVFRDIDNGKRGGCWLSTDPASGIRYDITNNVYPPDWNYAVLVEGVPNGEEQCGGVRLDPVRTSVLPERCPRHILPAEGYVLDRPLLPERNVRPTLEIRVAPDWPVRDRTIRLYFELNSDFITFYHTDYMIDTIVTWIKEAKPRRLVVTGFAVTDPVEVSGQMIAERPEMAKARAEKLEEVLIRYGIDKSIIETNWDYNPAPAPGDMWADGLVEPSRRRVEVKAVF